MSKLEIKQEDNFVTLSYDSKLDYFETRAEIEKDTRLDDSMVTDMLHKKYYNSLNYSLDELLNNFKTILKIYKNYLVFDYTFRGVYLKNHSIIHNYFDAHDEKLFNIKLLGEDLIKLNEVLSAQTKLGDIHIERFTFELAPVKNKRKMKQRKRTNIPRGMRHEVFKRDNYTCVECGAKKTDGVTLHIDHKIPVSKGGTDELSNLQTLCSDCNLNKSNIIQKTP